jgi:serine/threonine protein kinase
MIKSEPGLEIDGFLIGPLLHAGGMAKIYEVNYADQRAESFPMVIKIPLMRAGDGAENIIGFEIENQILQVLKGKHVPRFVASGDLTSLPYLVMEHIQGRTLQEVMDSSRTNKEKFTIQQIIKFGAETARAIHALHLQNTCHLDLKPANVILHPNGHAILLDYGLSCHAHYPDLLAEELRQAVGSPTWISPEQVVGIRGDPRSDIFAIGVIMYELATGELPFGNPVTKNGLRQRLWMDPRPPRAMNPEIPAFLQEIILRCLEPVADNRYSSAAHLLFDLENTDQVKITSRGEKLKSTSFATHFKRWIQAAGMQYKASSFPIQQIDKVPIVMVAVPHQDVDDSTLYTLRNAVSRSMGIRPGARLAVVTVISPGLGSTTEADKSEIEVHRKFLNYLKQWAMPLDLKHQFISYHVLESFDVAKALIRYAHGNNVDLIIMGAATHGLKLDRLIATVSIKVAMNSPCSIMLVKPKEAYVFEEL